MSAKELSLDTLDSFKVVEYEKLFQKEKIWKKAKGMIVLTDYKLGSKKVDIAIPYRKPAEMVKAFKKLKAEKKHPLKKVAAASFSLNKGEDGQLEAAVSLKKGGLSPEKLQEKMGGNFLGIGMNLIIDGLQKVVEAVGEVLESAVDAVVDASGIDLKALAKQASSSVNDFKGAYYPLYKEGQLGEEDLKDISTLKSNFQNFLEVYANEEDQEQLSKLEKVIRKYLPEVEKMETALDGSNPDAAKDLLLNQLSNAGKSIQKLTKKVKKKVIKHLKKEKTSDRDLDMVQELMDKIENFDTDYTDAEKDVQEQVKKYYDRIQEKIAPQMEQLLERVRAAAPGLADEQAFDHEFEARLQEAEQLLQEQQQLLEEAAKAADEQEQAEPLPQGEDFLSMLNF